MKAASRTHLRRLSIVVVPFALTGIAGLLSSACPVSPLDIGANVPVQHEDQEAPDSSKSDVAEAEAALTLESRLRARCIEEPGPSDDYFSGAGLTMRLAVRWFNCGSALSSPLQFGDGDGIVFTSDGRWAVLTWNARRDGFDVSTTELDFGRYRYQFFVDSEAGAAGEGGIVSGEIALEDTRNRTPLVVYLDRFGSPDGFNLSFSKKPRHMNVVESASPARAHYVAIE